MTQEYLPSTALIVIDMQHDFADPAGSLYVRGAEHLGQPIAAEIAAARAAGAAVVFTQDWHPQHTPHFVTGGGSWPVHCVMGTPGAEFVPGLLPAGEQPDPVVRKGSGQEDGYSGFSVLDLTTGEQKGTELSVILDSSGVMEIVVVGLAGDWCVKATAIDGVRLGYPVTVPLPLTRFVELAHGDTEQAVLDMRAAGVTVTD